MVIQAELDLPVDNRTVPAALEWLDAAGEQAAWPARTLFRLRLCLDETLTNIGMYGFSQGAVDDGPQGEGTCEGRRGGEGARDADVYKNGAGAEGAPRVRLRLVQQDARITLSIEDNGTAFDPTAAAPRSLDTKIETAQIGGHGLRLMMHYLEDLRYERRDGWNRLELVASVDTAA